MVRARNVLHKLPRTYLSVHVARVMATDYADRLGWSPLPAVNERRQCQYEHAEGWIAGRRGSGMDLMNWQIMPRSAQLAYLRGYGAGVRERVEAGR